MRSSQVLFTLALALGTTIYLVWELFRERPAVALEDLPRGRWGPHTAPIDWCEENYAVTESIAEFWNTITCAFYVAAAFQAVLDGKASRSCPDTYWAYTAALAMTGICSAIFHATLWWWGQKTDEMSECVTLVLLLYMPKSPNLPWPAHFLPWHVALAILGPAAIPQIFTEMHVVVLVCGLLHVYHGVLLEMPNLKPNVLRGAGFGVMGFACWLVDKTACSAWPRITAFQLHAWWHLFTALALYEVGWGALQVHGQGVHALRGRVK